MPSRRFKQLAFLPLFALIFVLGVRTAAACSCGPAPTVLDAFDHSDVVVVASALSVEKASPEQTAAPGRMSDGSNYVDGVRSTTMRVEQVFKGTLKVGDEMIFGQGGGASCIRTFNEKDVGQKFLFYLKRFNGSTRWFASDCGRSDRLHHAADDLLYLTNLDKVRNKTRISGKIRFDYDAGESRAGRKIRIVGAKRTQQLKTDENGVYEVYDMPAGRYFVEPEIPKGWKIAKFWLDYSPSLDRSVKELSLERIPIVLQANKHAALDIVFEIDNVVRGRIYDPLGQLMKGVCLNLVPADGSEGAYLADCTEDEGSFEIDQIPPGAYVIVINKDGKMTSTEPFGTFYYPKAGKREEATVFNIGIGDVVENLEIYPPMEIKTITVEGVLLFSDGKPIADEWVNFKSQRKPSAGKKEDEDDEDESTDAAAKTDSKGRFSMKIVHGVSGVLTGKMYSYVGLYENCPKLDRLVREAGTSVQGIKTSPVEIRATTNLYDVELKFPFPSCKKAK
jgi:hypothetical protein